MLLQTIQTRFNTKNAGSSATYDANFTWHAGAQERFVESGDLDCSNDAQIRNNKPTQCKKNTNVISLLAQR